MHASKASFVAAATSRQYALAVMNVAKLRAPLEDTLMDEFRHAIEPINLLAERSPGFVWMYIDDYSKEINIPELQQDALLMPQLSVWTDASSLMHFVFKSGHAMYYKRKREWFEPVSIPYSACWWHEMSDHDETEESMPTLQQAFERLRALRENNGVPDSFAFDLKSAKAETFLRGT